LRGIYTGCWSNDGFRMKASVGDIAAHEVKDWLEGEFDLPPQGTWPTSRHRFEVHDVWAIRAALVTRRPLLLRGKPGVGKSQLARAAAVKLGVPFLSVVVDERTERDDLLLSYDSVARLAEAQLTGAGGRKDGPAGRDKLNEVNFVRPGPMWWALNWRGAAEQADKYRQDGRTCDEPAQVEGWNPMLGGAAGIMLRGPVILVDEIDKADPSVPNGLLETLANDGFEVLMPSVRVGRCERVGPPLVVITTNEERQLPAAFIRRCLVHEMSFPKEDDEAKGFLRRRARIHHGPGEISDVVLDKVIARFMGDRQKADDEGLYQPGPAEFLDLVRALVEFGKAHGGEITSEKRHAAQEEALEQVGRFVFSKHLKEEI